MNVHIYAPEPTHEQAIVDYNCWHLAGGRRCGSYHALAVFTPYHGWRVTCCSCGGAVEDGEAVGKVRNVAKVRERFEAVRRVVVIREQIGAAT